MSVYDKIRNAIAHKTAIRVVFKGNARDVCPHVIGHKNGSEKVLAYQFAGYSSSGLPPEGEWRCMFVKDISDASDIDGTWRTGTEHSQAQTCVDEVDLEVDYLA
jgi:hypothetical protein